MTDKSPQISIVTPSFNQGNFLEVTIQSILSQNYPNLQYIIIDGGSTDGSVEIIKKYEKHLHFWCSEPDGGQYQAINKGFSHATGEIMAWLNSDDIYCPWALKTVASIFSDLPQVEWLTTLNPGIWDYHGFCRGFGSIPGYSKEAFLDGCYVPWGKKSIAWIQQESTFWRRNLWQKIGGQIRTDFKLAADFNLWSRFFMYADLYGTTSPLGGFRVQINQKTRQVEQYVFEAEQSLAAMQSTLGFSPNYLREIALNLQLNKLPKLKILIKSIYSYRGKRVIRKKLESPDGFWDIEEYQFYEKFISLLK